MLKKGDLKKIKQIFGYVNQEHISIEDMGVRNNVVNHGREPTFVDIKFNEGTVPRITVPGTPLIIAAYFGHHLVCEYLITQQNANLEMRTDDDDRTALTYAVVQNHVEVIKVLLQNNANVKAKSKYGRSKLL